MFNGYFTKTIHEQRGCESIETCLSLTEQLKTSRQKDISECESVQRSNGIPKGIDPVKSLIDKNRHLVYNENYYVFGFKIQPPKSGSNSDHMNNNDSIINRINTELLKTRPVKFIMKFFSQSKEQI